MCTHLEQLPKELPYPKSLFAKFECEECARINSWWVNLRICQTCGKMLCRDSSPNQHARKHFEESGHPIIISAEMGDTWKYCYLDDETV